jgi:dihydrofolate reductase
MSKITSSTFVSLDGFTAKTNGDISWFEPNQEFFEYSGLLIQNSDTAIYGRKTYEMMNSYWPTAADEPDANPHDIEHGHWYNKARKIVFSNSLGNENLENTIFLGENSVEKLSQIKQDSSKDMVIFGSPSIVSLLTDAGLIDEYYIFVAPIILTEGLPLFKNIEHQTKLKLLESRQLENGVVVLHYQKVN